MSTGVEGMVNLWQSYWIPLVFLLGIRHGFDVDHIAAIDGLCRLNVGERPRLAKRSGLLFSIGHGLVVTMVATAVAVMGSTVAAPAWLKMSGLWTSVLLLWGIGLLNLLDIRSHSEGRPPRLVRWIRLWGRPGPATIIGTGALFAVAFDTVSQVTAWSLAGLLLGGAWFGVLIGAVFTSGMMLSDGANGVWLARVCAWSERDVPGARRAAALSIGIASCTVALAESIGIAVPAVGWSWLPLYVVISTVAVVPAIAVSFYGRSRRHTVTP